MQQQQKKEMMVIIIKSNLRIRKLHGKLIVSCIHTADKQTLLTTRAKI